MRREVARIAFACAFAGTILSCMAYMPAFLTICVAITWLVIGCAFWGYTEL